MGFVLSFILLFVFAVLTILILRGNFTELRTLPSPDVPGYSYIMQPLMLYAIFIIVTGPFFLVQPITILKYIVYLLTLLYIVFFKRVELPKGIIPVSYWIFFIWLLITICWTNYPYEAFTLVIKYIIPILSLYLGYAAISNRYDLLYMLKFISIAALIYTFLIGGLSARFYDWLYFSEPFKVFLKYAGFADYMTALFVAPLLLHWWTGKKVWLLVAGAMFLSTLLEVVRTGLGGMAIIAAVYMLLRYKAKALPGLVLVGALSLAVVLYVPEVNEKFFGANAGTITAENIINDDAMSFDKIQTNARQFMWEKTMEECYDGHELAGSGLGSGNFVIKVLALQYNVASLLHNDYVQMLCDGGIIAVCLYAIFVLSVVFYSFKEAWFTNNYILKISATLALCSLLGISFSMAFDNVVSHSMSSMIIPFIFTGMFIKMMKVENE